MTEFIVLGLLLAFVLGWKTPEWIGRYLVNSEKRRIMRSLTPEPLDEWRLCQGPHKWVDIPSTDENGKIASINACDVCGFLPGREVMASQEALARAREIKKRIDIENKIIDEFSLQEENSLKEHFSEELSKGMDLQKAMLAYRAGQTLQQRFILFKIQKLNEIEKSTNEERVS